MPMGRLEVLHEDNHLLAVNKPAGLPTMGVAAGKPSLLTAAKAYLKQKYNKPGQVYLGVVSRIDTPVTGVVIFARTSKAAARLMAAFRDHTVDKRYWTLVEDSKLGSAGTLRHALRKDERQRRMIVCPADHPLASSAELRFQKRGQADRWTWYEIELITGRKHQIRVQLAAARSPIVGDRRYGSRRPFPQGIALHARRLSLRHPVRHELLVIEAPLPTYWPALESSPGADELETGDGGRRRAIQAETC